MSTTTDLIANASPDHWQVINLSNIDGVWIKTTAGAITQTQELNEPWGSVLLLHSEEESFDTMGLRSALTQQGQTGIVYQYIDEQNFSLFQVEHREFSNYQARLIIRKEGTYKTALTKEFTYSLPEMILVIVLMQDGVSFQTGQGEVFKWDQPIISPGNVGLYCNKVRQATFVNLVVGRLDQMSDEIIELPVEEVTVLDQYSEAPKRPQEITSYLKIATPRSETQVEFSEVFTVPLDSFYVSLYRNYGEKKIEPASQEESTSDTSLNRGGSLMLPYNLSTDKFIVISSQGLTSTERFTFPFERMYAGVYDKSTLLPIKEYTQKITGNFIKGFLPTGNHLISVTVSVSTKEVSVATHAEHEVARLLEPVYSPSGKWWIGKDAFNNAFALMDTATRTQLFSLVVDTPNGHTILDDARTVLFSPDEKFVLGVLDKYSGKYGDHSIVVWNTSTGEMVRQVMFDEGIHFRNIVFSKRPDAVYNVIVPLMQRCCLLDSDTWTIRQQFSSADTRPQFSSDGKYILTYKRWQDVQVWDPITFTALGQLQAQAGWALPLRDGEVIYTSGNKLFVWNYLSGTQTAVSHNEVDEISDGGVSPDGASFFIRTGNRIEILDTASKQTRASFSRPSVNKLRFSADGTRLIQSDGRESFVIHIPSNVITAPADHLAEITQASCTEDGTAMLLQTKNGQLHIWDTLGPVQFSAPAEYLMGSAISPDGKSFIKQTVSVALKDVDPDTLKERNEIPLDLASLVNTLNTGLPVLALSPDGNNLLYPGPQQTALLWNFTTSAATPVNNLSDADLRFGQVMFSPDSSKLLARSKNGYLVEVTLASGALKRYDIANEEGQDTPSTPLLCFSYDGTGEKIISYHQDRKFRLWDVAGSTAPTLLFPDLSTEAPGNFMGVSPDGNRFFLLRQKSISLFSVRTKQEEEVIALTIPSEGMGPFIWFTPNSSALAIPSLKEVVIHKLKKTEAPVVERADVPTSFAYLLDYRPKRWYRALKFAHEQEIHNNHLAQQFKKAVDDLRMSMFKAPAADTTNENPPTLFSKIKDGLFEMTAYQQKFQEAITQRNKALDAQQDISREVRTNGYNLVFKEGESGLYTYVHGIKRHFEGELVIDEELTKKGYEFAIIGGKPKVKRFTPYNIDSLNYHDNTSWRVFWGKFRAYMLDQDALTDEKRNAFEKQAKELQNMDINGKIRQQKELLLKDIAVAKDAGKKLDVQLASIESEIALWEKDKDLVSKIDLSSYSAVYNYLNYERSKLKKIGPQFSLSTSSWGDTIRVRHLLKKILWVSLYITKTYNRTNYRYTITFTPIIKEKPVFSTVWNYATGEEQTYNYISGNSLANFITLLRKECDDNLSNLRESRERTKNDMAKIDNELLFHGAALDDLMLNALVDERKKFVAYWNDPNQFGAMDTLENQIMPEADPLADLLVSLQYPDEAMAGTQASTIPLEQLKWKTDYFSFSGDRFYNEEGLTLQSYLEFLKGSKSKRVAIFPKMEDDGTINTEAYVAVVNPQPALSMDDDLPVIKFVETYRIGIRWTGYSLGELSHTENLFPNETKEIKIERTIKLISKQEESRLTSQTTSRKTSSSFDENLQKEISLKDVGSQEREDSATSASKTSRETDAESQQSQSTEFNFNMDLPDFIPGVSGGMDFKKRNESSSKNSRKDSFEKSQSQTGRTASKESRESFSKDTSNTVRKIAGETSQENKVEIKVNTSEELTTSDSRVETIKLENPNAGRTINYYFFQVQNGYEVTTSLIDVKVVVDMNREIIKGSTVTDVRVFDLVELGKIFSDESDDPRYLLTAAIIARQAFRNYLTGLPGISRGNGALRINQNYVVNRDFIDVVNFTKKLTRTQAKSENLLSDLYEAMAYLKQVPFEFHETEVNLPKEYFINAGGYYLESEVGRMPATEKYLEDRRDIETDQKKAELEYLRQRTQKGAFYPEIPDSVTHLNYDNRLDYVEGKEKPVESGNG